MTELPKLIDTHCHLDFDYETKTHRDLVEEAHAAGVEILITIATEMSHLSKIAKISEQYEHVFHTVGVHPHDAKDIQEGDRDRLLQAATHPKCKAIGEIGLDYHYDHSPREIQREQFKNQLEVALQSQLPVVIHTRDAEEDSLLLLTEYCEKLPKGRIPGVIHCFTGTQKFGLACLDLGFYISFSGIVTFKKSTELKECARVFPIDRLLVETDSPFLAPVPFRGKKCEPSMIVQTARMLAELKGLSFEDVARQTNQNSRAVFDLGELA